MSRGYKLFRTMRWVKQHIGGVFALGGHPVVLEPHQGIVQQRIDLMGEGFQNCWPIERGESIRKGLGAIDILNLGEDIIDLDG